MFLVKAFLDDAKKDFLDKWEKPSQVLLIYILRLV